MNPPQSQDLSDDMMKKRRCPFKWEIKDETKDFINIPDTSNVNTDRRKGINNENEQEVKYENYQEDVNQLWNEVKRDLLMEELVKYCQHSDKKIKEYELEKELILKDREIARLQNDLAREKCEKIITRDDYNELVESVNRELGKLQDALNHYKTHCEDLAKNVVELTEEVKKVNNRSGLMISNQISLRRSVYRILDDQGLLNKNDDEL